MIKPPLGFIIIAYALLNIAYSKWLKHFVIFDVFVIAVGFVIRILAGGIVAEVMVSHWLLICTLLLALFLGFSKRRYELIVLAAEATLHRKVLAEYNPQFLDMMIGIVTSATAVTYILYTVSIETVQRFHTNGLLVTVPFVLYGIFRYLYLVYQKNQGGSPSHSFFIDGPLLGNAVLWIIVSGLIIYTAAP
jgi:4-hydroxybenzoate polyprenyltransferase